MPRAPLGEPDQSRGELRRESGRFHSVGARMALVGLPLVAIGLLIFFLTDGAGNFIGLLIATLSAVVAAVGLALEVIAAVSRRASADRPFA